MYYPRGGDGSLAPVVLELREHSAEIVADGTPATFEPRRSGHAKIRTRANQEAIVGRIGSTYEVTLNNEETPGFVKLEYDLPARLSEMPENAKVVFLMDRSRSIDEELLEAQFDVIEGFASYLPDAHFELVMVDRFASPMLGELTAHEEFLDAVGTLRESGVTLKNGSNLDEGLSMGREILDDVEGPRFIIALTDDQLRRSWDTSVHAQSTDITTHVVVLDRGFKRDDTHRLSPIALQDGGILVHTGIHHRLQVELEHLVRPIRLEYISITGVDDNIHNLEEGTSYRLFQAFENPIEGALHAKIWTQPIEVSPHSRPAFDRATDGRGMLWVWLSPQ